MTDAQVHRRWDVLAAAPALVLLGLGLPLAAGVTSATAVVLGLAPVWFPAVRRSSGISALLVVTALAVPAGLLLAWTVGPPSGRGWDGFSALFVGLLVLTAAGGTGLVLWTRSVLPLHTVALLLGVGLMADAFRTAEASPNAWKFSFSLPLTVVVLALLGRRHPWLTTAALLGFAAGGVAADSRSYSAFCVLTAALVLWRAGPGSAHGRLRMTAVIGATALAGYQVGTELLVQGYLGEVLQQRSVEQVQRAGSLLAGGRPEWAATRALFVEHPWGFGLGAVPASEDLRTAKAGLDTVGISGSNGYVKHYMFGGGFKLHSVVADLWSFFGVAGLALGALLLALVVRSFVTVLAVGRPAPVVVFLCILSLWWLLFGPLQSNFADICIVLGLAAPMRDAHDPG